MRTFKDTRGKSWFDIVPETKGQIDITISYPGTVRAFHYHKEKTEWMFVVQGEYKFVLITEEKLTVENGYENKEIVYLSQGDVIKIKPGAWHGYQVLGNQPGIIMEYASHKHDLKEPDDYRKPWNTYDDWEREKK